MSNGKIVDFEQNCLDARAADARRHGLGEIKIEASSGWSSEEEKEPTNTPTQDENSPRYLPSSPVQVPMSSGTQGSSILVESSDDEETKERRRRGLEEAELKIRIYGSIGTSLAEEKKRIRGQWNNMARGIVNAMPLDKCQDDNKALDTNFRELYRQYKNTNR